MKWNRCHSSWGQKASLTSAELAVSPVAVPCRGEVPTGISSSDLCIFSLLPMKTFSCSVFRSTLCRYKQCHTTFFVLVTKDGHFIVFFSDNTAVNFVTCYSFTWIMECLRRSGKAGLKFGDQDPWSERRRRPPAFQLSPIFLVCVYFFYAKWSS